MNRYKTRPGKQLRVLGQRVTDAAAGVLLPDTPGVREHVALDRLILVKPAEAALEETTTTPAKRRSKEGKQ